MPALFLHYPLSSSRLLISSSSSCSIRNRRIQSLNCSSHCPPFPLRQYTPKSSLSKSRCTGGGNGNVHDSPSLEAAVDEAREAVVELLQEYGVSREDSLNIASNSPKYIEFLMENVRELDEHSLWSSWGAAGEIQGGGGDAAGGGFRRKVYYMAKSKGDGGILPLLESIGLKHSSAIYISRLDF